MNYVDLLKDTNIKSCLQNIENYLLKKDSKYFFIVSMLGVSQTSLYDKLLISKSLDFNHSKEFCSYLIIFSVLTF